MVGAADNLAAILSDSKIERAAVKLYGQNRMCY